MTSPEQQDQGPRSPHEVDEWWPEPVPDNVELGDGVWLYSSYAFRHCRSRRHPAVCIGPDSGIYDGTSFELGPEGQVITGRFCTLVAPVFATNGTVTIGDHAFIAHGVTFADTPAATPTPEDRTRSRTLGHDVWIGARATLLPPADLGNGVIVGAGTVVNRSFPDHSVIAGVPARIVGWAHPGDGS